MKCDRYDFNIKGIKRGRLRKRLDKHRKVCEAAMENVAEQEDLMENSVF
jgi:hypothetical protein